MNKEKKIALGLKALREKCVRQGFFEPRDDMERRQAEEGPIPQKEFDCFKN